MMLDPLRVCASYRPKFGQGIKSGGLTLSQFQDLYQKDAFYSWLGLDNALMYAAHKAAGGITSIYRQIGIGCERLFRAILRDSFGLSEEEVRWTYRLDLPSGKSRSLSLDGRVQKAGIVDREKRKRFEHWMRQSCEALGIDNKVIRGLTGTVFEVRQGYKSKDSKRQNADLANAATAYTKGYLPCAVILSTQIDGDIRLRYRMQQWVILTGTMGQGDPLVSTYDFMAQVAGYDLAGFFERNSQQLRTELDLILKALLAPETT